MIIEGKNDATRAVAIHDKLILMTPSVAADLRGMSVYVSKTNVKGKDVDCVPHNVQSTRLLRNAGVLVRSNMSMGGYKFSGPFKPYAHQIETAEFLVTHPRSLCLNSPGTGKTASSIWAAEFLKQQRAVRKVLVFCPLSCVESVWAREIFAINPAAKVLTLTGPTKNRIEAIQNKADYIVTNHDAAANMWEALANPDLGVDLVIVDEATAFKTESAARTSGLRKILKGRCYWLMTGTPTPQEPTDAYMLCKLVNPDAPQSMSAFRSYTMTQLNRFKWVAKKDAVNTVASFMTPAVRFDKKDCIDMPPITMEDRFVDMMPSQTKAITDLKKDWVHENAGQKVVALNAAVRIGKVFQIGQGCVISDSGVMMLGADKRIQSCVDLITESLSKTIVFVSFRASAEYVFAELSKKFGCVLVHGDVSPSDRTARFKAFEYDPDTRVLVAHPATTSHGLTLVSASTTIWFGPYNKFEVYDQANQRTDRPGQKHNMRIINLYSTPEELVTYKAARKAIDSQTAVMQLKKLVMVDQ